VARCLILVKGTEFTGEQVYRLGKGLGRKQIFSLVEHAQTNVQIEAANKVTLRSLKHQINTTNGSWLNEVPQILWAYTILSHS